MSAIQKYKKQALDLEKQVIDLKAENEKLRQGITLSGSDAEKVYADPEDRFLDQAKDLVNLIVTTPIDHFSKPAMISKVEMALVQAYLDGQREGTS